MSGPRKGPGRPPVDPKGKGSRVAFMLTAKQRATAERIARREGFVDNDGRPIMAAAVRWLLDRAAE